MFPPGREERHRAARALIRRCQRSSSMVQLFCFTFSQRGVSATGAPSSGAHRERLPPHASLPPQRLAVQGAASPGCASPHAPLSPCVAHPVGSSRSCRDARGCCWSNPHDTIDTYVSEYRMNRQTPPVTGGTVRHSEHIAQFCDRDSRWKEPFVPRRSVREAAGSRDGRYGRVQRR